MPWRTCEIHGEVERGGICGSCAVERRAHLERQERAFEATRGRVRDRLEALERVAEAAREVAGAMTEWAAAARKAQRDGGDRGPLASSPPLVLRAVEEYARELATALAALPGKEG